MTQSEAKSEAKGTLSQASRRPRWECPSRKAGMANVAYSPLLAPTTCSTYVPLEG